MFSTLFIIAQLVGFLGMGLDIYASLIRDDRRMRIVAGLASAVLSLHFFLLGAVSGAITEFLNSGRTFLSVWVKSRKIGSVFVLLYVLAIFMIAENFVEALPFIASISTSVGLYFFAGHIMRIFYIIAWALWLAYSIHVFSIGGIALFSVMFVTTSYTTIRMRQTIKQAFMPAKQRSLAAVFREFQ